MSKKSIFCIANSRNLAELIVDQLKFYSISSRNISLLYSDVEKNGWKSHHFGADPDAPVPDAVRAGAGAGAVPGGTVGWIMGIGALTIPGAGQFIAAGPIIASLSRAAAGSAAGGIAGGLITMGIPERQAKNYEDRIRLGNILISVHTESPAEVIQAKFIFTRGRGQDIYIADEAFSPRWHGAADQPLERAPFACN